ncbi:MAG: hypothetical protein DRQ54_10900 [Gammaproteobacteria bacterium]|nr:MAG: hypothetical protein DRQ54_10900 [Gammaproteobacteria bacterium]
MPLKYNSLQLNSWGTSSVVTLTKPIDLDAPPTDACLQSTRYFDCDDPNVQAYASKVVGSADTDVEKIVRLYYAVRDQFRYDPRHFMLTKEQFCCRQVLRDKRGFCMPKAVLLSTLARTQGIASGIGFAHVKTRKWNCRTSRNCHGHKRAGCPINDGSGKVVHWPANYCGASQASTFNRRY